MNNKGVLALCKASLRVRNGRWINGAPSHIFAELLTELEKDGWVLRRKPTPVDYHEDEVLGGQKGQEDWPEDD
jgi:hypothetical protein